MNTDAPPVKGFRDPFPKRIFIVGVAKPKAKGRVDLSKPAVILGRRRMVFLRAYRSREEAQKYANMLFNIDTEFKDVAPVPTTTDEALRICNMRKLSGLALADAPRRIFWLIGSTKLSK